MARRRRSSRRRAPARRRTSTRSSRRGSAPVNLLVGTTLGAAAAIGSAVLVNRAAAMAGQTLPPIAQRFAPLVGAGAVAALAAVAPKFKTLTMPALIGGAAVMALDWFMARNNTPAAGAYRRLAGAGNVARTLAPNGAGNVARTLAPAYAAA